MIRALLRVQSDSDAIAPVMLFDKAQSMNEIRRMIGAGSLDTVTVRRPILLEMPTPMLIDALKESHLPPRPTQYRVDFGHVLIVDDVGMISGKPRNDLASQIYAAQCKPEFRESATIYGDAFICPDSDFGGIV